MVSTGYVTPNTHTGKSRDTVLVEVLYDSQSHRGLSKSIIKSQNSKALKPEVGTNYVLTTK